MTAKTGIATSTEPICNYRKRPECNGLPCLCPTCQPIDCCQPQKENGGCLICEGPVTECPGFNPKKGK